MNFADILAPESVSIDVDVRTKIGALEALARLVGTHDKTLECSEILASLAARESLGSTALGHGVAVPHGRLQQATHIAGALLRVPQGVGFDARDDIPVDLFFALTIPGDCADEHLRILAQLAELFSDAHTVDRLREAQSPLELYSLLVAWRPLP